MINTITNNGKTEQKLWIIGDSFTGLNANDASWQLCLYRNFIGKRIHVSSKGSRDVQTVIDVFLRNLKDIKSEDLVILFLPTTARYRLPRIKPLMDVEWSDRLRTVEQKSKHLEYFTHLKFIDNGESILEYPLGLVDESMWQVSPPDYKHPNNKNINFTYADILLLTSASNAMKNNLNEMLFSFKNYFPFKLLLFSWTDEYDENVVIGKTEITNEVGFWHTLHNEWLESNQTSGKYQDAHFSRKMNIGFAEYIINKFPEYFNK